MVFDIVAGLSKMPTAEEETSDNDENGAEFDIQTYGLRWWIAFVLALLLIMIRLIANSIGVVNNVYKAYFHVSIYAVDWFTMVQIPGVMVGCIVMAKLTYHSIVDLRRLCLIASVVTFLSCALMIVAFIFPHLYGLIFVGHLLLGLGSPSAFALINMFSTSWFPENQVGLALSFESMGMSIGTLLAFFIPSQLFESPPANLTKEKTFDLPRNNTFNEATHWQNKTQLRFLFLFGVALLICLFIVIFIFVYVVDQPPKPPSLAQAKARAKKTKTEQKKFIANFKEFFEEVGKVLGDKAVIQFIVITSILGSVNYLQQLLMSELVRHVFKAIKHNSKINAMSGYVLICYEIGCFLGSLISGKVIDYTKKYKVVVAVSVGLYFMSFSALTVGYYFYNIPSVYIFNALLGLFACFSKIPLFDMLLQHTYPKNPGFVSLTTLSVRLIAAVIFGQTSRVLLEFINGTAVLIVYCTFTFVAFVVSLFLNPNYKRIQNDSDNFRSEEETALLCETNDLTP